MTTETRSFNPDQPRDGDGKWSSGGGGSGSESSAKGGGFADPTGFLGFAKAPPSVSDVHPGDAVFAGLKDGGKVAIIVDKVDAAGYHGKVDISYSGPDAWKAGYVHGENVTIPVDKVQKHRENKREEWAAEREEDEAYYKEWKAEQDSRERNLNLPLQTRFATVVPTTVDVPARTVEVMWGTGAAVRRVDPFGGGTYDEVLSMAPEAVDMTLLSGGTANLLDNHDWYGGVRSVLGVVTKAWIANGEGHAVIRFSRRADVDPIWQDVQDGILRNISVGYAVERLEIESPPGGVPLHRVVRWRPQELSLVSVPAEPGAATRSAERPTYPCTIVQPQEDPLSKDNSESKKDGSKETPPCPDCAAKSDTVARAAPGQVHAAAAEYAARIADLCLLAGRPEAAVEFISRGLTADQVRSALLEARAADTAALSATRPADGTRSAAPEAPDHKAIYTRFNQGSVTR